MSVRAAALRLVPLALLLAALLGPQAGSAAIRFDAKLGGVDDPRNASVDCHGDIYVAEPEGVVKLTPSGKKTHFASVPGLSAVAADCAGNVYLLDAAGSRVLKYLDVGGYGLEWSEWGGRGAAHGELDRPQDLAVDRDGHVYVADTGNNRVERFSGEGHYLGGWGGAGAGDGKFQAPKAIDIDTRGRVYVLDRGNWRVEKFSPAGEFLGQFGSRTYFRTQPVGLAADATGVYVLEERGGLLRFNSVGTYLDRMEVVTVTDEFRDPGGLAADRAGRVYVADTGNHFYLKRYAYHPELPSFVAALGGPGIGNGQYRGPRGVAVDPGGSVYVADTGNKRIQKLNAAGAFVKAWGGENVFRGPTGVAAGPANVYVADPAGHGVQKFTSGGDFVRAWTSAGADEGQVNPHAPTGIAVQQALDTGDVWLADAANDIVQSYSSAGTYIGRMGATGTAHGRFRSPHGVATDTLGNVYIADTGNDRIEKLGGEGGFHRAWGGTGTAVDDLKAPRGIAIDARGNLLVADTGNDRIVKYDPYGGFLYAWGSKGTGRGQFNAPEAVAASANGTIYVADTGNDRIQKFHDPAIAPLPAPLLKLQVGAPEPESDQDGGGRECEATTLVATLTGQEVGEVRRVEFLLGGHRAGNDRAWPFHKRIHRPKRGGRHRYRVRARVLLEGGRHEVLTNSFNACPARAGEIKFEILRKKRRAWHHFEGIVYAFPQQAYDRSNGCLNEPGEKPVFGIGGGSCYGPSGGGPAPFDGSSKHSLVEWYPREGKVHLLVLLDPNETGREGLRGWLPHPPAGDASPSGPFIVTEGDIDEWVTVSAHSGTDLNLVGKQGGPLHYKATFVNRASIGSDLHGYRLDLSGYLFY